MDLNSTLQTCKDFFVKFCNYSREYYLSFKQIVNIHLYLLVAFIIISSILLIILIIVLLTKKTATIYNYENYQEKIVFNHRLEIIKISDKFTDFLAIDKTDVLKELQIKYSDFYNLFIEAIKNKKSFVYSLSERPVNMVINYHYEDITILLSLNVEKILDDFPIPISIDLGYAQINNKCFSNFGKLQSAEFFTKGQFFLKHDNIFKRESVFMNDMNFSILFPIMLQSDFLQIAQNKNELPPISMCLLHRSGEIITKTEKFKSIFNIDQDITTFQDFLEAIRSYILHDEIFFADFKKHFLNMFLNLSTQVDETYSTIDGKVFLFRFIPNGDRIFFMLEDITLFSINKTQEFLFKDVKTKLLPQISDFIVFVDAEGVIENSNCDLLTTGDKVSTAKTILKFFTTPDNGIQEINLSNNGKCLLVKNSVKDKIFKVKTSVVSYLDKIIKILQLLNNTIDGSLEEYLKYIKFLIINVENNMKTLELGVNRSYQNSNFQIIQEFNIIKSELEQALSFKNLNVSLPSQDIIISNSKEVICLLLENILLIAFKYQFNQKNLIIEDKNEKIYITLDGINREEVEKIYAMFDLINHINIFSTIKELGDKISIGFYFDKIAPIGKNN